VSAGKAKLPTNQSASRVNSVAGGNGILEIEIARLESRIEAIEGGSNALKESIIKEVMEKMAVKNKDNDVAIAAVLAQVESQPAMIEAGVLERVAEMLTDNIYDIIPGY